MRDRQDQIRDDWRVNAPPWAAKIKQTRFTALPASQVLQEGNFMRVPVATNRAVIVDVAYADAPAEVHLLPFTNAGPVLGIQDEFLNVPGAHLIQVYPPEGEANVTELLVWAADGTIKVRVWSVAKDATGKALFPCQLALGEEPLWQPYFNCGPQGTLELGEKVTSLASAISLMKDTRVRKYFQLSSTAAIDESELGKRARVRKLGTRTLYEWIYTAEHCGTDSHWFRVTSDGWVSQFGCCGK